MHGRVCYIPVLKKRHGSPGQATLHFKKKDASSARYISSETPHHLVTIMQTPRQNEARIRTIAFWKKHQSILQNCADLSQLCDMKILVCFD
jgi:hypothetical protein